jgi:hypothetical protein
MGHFPRPLPSGWSSLSSGKTVFFELPRAPSAPAGSHRSRSEQTSYPLPYLPCRWLLGRGPEACPKVDTAWCYLGGHRRAICDPS